MSIALVIEFSDCAYIDSFTAFLSLSCFLESGLAGVYLSQPIEPSLVLLIYDGLVLFLISYTFREGWREESGRMGCYMLGWWRGGGVRWIKILVENIRIKKQRQ